MRTGTSAPKGYYKSGKNLRYKRALPLDPATARLNHALDSLKQAVAKPFNIKSRIDVFDDALQTLLVLRGSFQPALARSGCRQSAPDPSNGGFVQEDLLHMSWLHGCTIAHQVLEVMVCKRLAELGRDFPCADVVESLAAINHDSVGLGCTLRICVARRRT